MGMKLYFAGLASHPDVVSQLDHPALLVSFPAWSQDALTALNLGADSLFLDSGAFTAYNTGKPVDLDQYISFIKSHVGHFEVVAGLDVIGDPDASWRNYQVMRDAGLSILPTYHLGSPWLYLEQLLDNYPYVAIGGVAIRVSKGLYAKTSLWRGLVHAHKLAQQRQVKLHGFGVTDWRMVRLLPWYSIDSTTYLVGARFGHVLSYENGMVGNRIRAEQVGIIAARRRLAAYLARCPFRHSFTVDDLLPLADSKQASSNRLTFNCMVMQYGVDRLNHHYATLSSDLAAAKAGRADIGAG